MQFGRPRQPISAHKAAVGIGQANLNVLFACSLNTRPCSASQALLGRALTSIGR